MLAVFDCDGVLVDSEPISNRVMAAVITEAGLPIDAEETSRAFEGMRLDDIQAEIEKQLGMRLGADWLSAFESRRAVAFTEGLDPIPDVEVVLSQIRDASHPCCVASQASRQKMELVLGLTGLVSYFRVDELFSSRMVEHGKPHPDLFLFAAESMGFKPADCVVIEDGVLGVVGARRAGMRVLGYAPDGNGDRLASEGATVFGSMTELPGLLGLG